MRLVVITPPDPVVAWGDADTHLRLDGDTTDQSYVEALIAAATAHIDGPSGWLGRAIGVQTLEARIDDFAPDRDQCRVFGMCRDAQWPIILPCPPIMSIASVKYVDSDGVEQTVDNTIYELLGQELAPVYDASWPSPRTEREAVRIRYQAGYDTIPAPIKAAILLMVGDLYANRETTLDATARGAAAIPMSTTVENLLAPYRIWR